MQRLGTTFAFGMDSIRARFLPKVRPVQAAISHLQTAEESRAQKATRLMRNWEYAFPGDARHKVYLECRQFVFGEVPLDELKELNIEDQRNTGRKIRRAAILENSTEAMQRERFGLERILTEHVKKWRYDETDWKHVSVSSVIEHFKKKPKLIWADSKDELTENDRETFRCRVDNLSDAGTVLLVFAPPSLLYEVWRPLMQDGFAGSLLIHL